MGIKITLPKIDKCHGLTNLDNHGRSSKLYTWKEFVFMEELNDGSYKMNKENGLVK